MRKRQCDTKQVLQRDISTWGIKMTKSKIKQTQQENLSKAVKDLLAEVDWDLLEQMDLEDEPQVLPMQDQPSLQFKTMSQESSRSVLRVDHFPQFKRQVPKK